jgi:hypothetical protein
MHKMIDLARPVRQFAAPEHVRFDVFMTPLLLMTLVASLGPMGPSHLLMKPQMITGGSVE